jgi:ATP-binding cassette subfamily F protein 3
MAALLLRPANLLILDEPTNHLDITSQEVLARALRHYDGTVVFVSHDRFFIREVATEVLALWPLDQRGSGGHSTEIPADGWQLYPGSYAEFEKSGVGWVFENATENGNATSVSRKQATAEQRATSGAQQQGGAGGSESFSAQKARKAELRKLKKQEEELLGRIEELEAEHTRLVNDLAKEEVYRDPDALKTTQQAIANNEGAQSEAHEEWESVSESLADMGQY